MNERTHIRFREARQTWYDPESMHVLADRFWHVLILIAFVVVISCFVYGTINLFRVLDEFNAPVVAQKSDTAASVLDRTQLESTLSVYENRKTQYQALQAASSTPVAPSKSAR